MAFASYLMALTFKQNAYLVKVVKVQEKQKVVDTGLYAYVRHPMYSALFMLMFGGSILLESLYGIYTCIAIVIIMTIRAIFEEKKLKKELEGYDEYMKKVKSRFIPYIF